MNGDLVYKNSFCNCGLRYVYRILKGLGMLEMSAQIENRFLFESGKKNYFFLRNLSSLSNGKVIPHWSDILDTMRG